MNDKAYFERLAQLAAEGIQRVDEGKRVAGCKMDIVREVAKASEKEIRFVQIRHAAKSRLVQCTAAAGYMLTAALGVLALTMSVECVVSELPARMWMTYAGAAVVSLLIGVAAHAVYDQM